MVSIYQKLLDEQTRLQGERDVYTRLSEFVKQLHEEYQAASAQLLEKNPSAMSEDELRQFATELTLFKARMNTVTNFTESLSLKLQSNNRRTNEWGRKVERLMEKGK